MGFSADYLIFTIYFGNNSHLVHFIGLFFTFLELKVEWCRGVLTMLYNV